MNSIIIYPIEENKLFNMIGLIKDISGEYSFYIQYFSENRIEIVLNGYDRLKLYFEKKGSYEYIYKDSNIIISLPIISKKENKEIFDEILKVLSTGEKCYLIPDDRKDDFKIVERKIK